MKNKALCSITKLLIPIMFLALIESGVVRADTLSKTSLETQVRDVVTEMNQAVTDKNLDRLLATFSNNAVRFNLYRAHANDTDNDRPNAADQVSDLAGIWKTVAQIIFSTTRFYERTITSMDIHSDNGMAVVWATIDTRSQSLKEGAEIKTNSFSEVYLLRHDSNEWKIVAMTNNRKDNYSK